MSKHLSSVIWASAITLVAFMYLLFLSCQHTDEDITDCIRQGRDPHVCACAMAPNRTNYCNK